jgi:glycosyltransferase involved in cell wall biosynthesis
VGYTTAGLGLGIAARNTVRYLTARGFPVSVVDLPSPSNTSRGDPGLERQLLRPGEVPPYGVNIFHLNPPELLQLLASQRDRFELVSSLNVTVPFWEVPRVPTLWLPTLWAMDVALAASRYLYEVLSADLPRRQVLYYPQVLSVPRSVSPDRRRWGFPDDAAVFLTSFDVKSDIVRKNPMGAVEAFRRAFPRPSGGTMLVVKMSMPRLKAGETAVVEAVRTLAAETPGVVLIESDLSYEDLLCLYASADVLVSLARAEGLGMLVVEGMALGKPVISTAWSGTMDFTTADNSCLVPFHPVPVRGGNIQYSSLFVGRRVWWAEPDLDEAARWMRSLAGDPELRAQIGGRAAREVRRRQKNNAAADFPERLRARYAELVARPNAGRGWRQRHAEAMLSGAHGAYDGAAGVYRFARSVKALA